MLKSSFVQLLVLITFDLPIVFGQARIPEVRIKVYDKRGFEVSIPADETATSFHFHGKVNTQFRDSENGTLDSIIFKKEGDRFTYTNQLVDIKIGDILYYWIDVFHNGVASRGRHERFRVRNYTNVDTVPDIKLFLPPDTPDPEDCTASVTVSNGKKVKCAGMVIFQSNTSSQFLQWTKSRRFGGQPDFEFVTYLPIDNNSFNYQGRLEIKPKRLIDLVEDSTLRGALTLGPNCSGKIGSEDCTRNNTFDIIPPMVSAQISTKGFFSFLYGRVEIIAKIPSLEWAFPQFFLEPVNNTYGELNYASGQMRVAFTRGSDTCNLFGGVILNNGESWRYNQMCEKQHVGNDYGAFYHLYELKWTPDEIQILVDREVYCVINPPEGFSHITVDGEKLSNSGLLERSSRMAPFDQPFYLTIGLGFGGHADFPDTIPDKPWENSSPRAMSKFWKQMKPKLYPEGSLIIDSIRVFSV